MGTEFLTLHPKLQLIICFINYFGLSHGEEVTWTEFYRSDTEQLQYYEQEVARLIAAGQDPEKAVSKRTSVHQFGRGGDFRPFKNYDLNIRIEQKVNAIFPYDPKRPEIKTLLFHEGTAIHGHVQVMENYEEVKTLEA